MITVSKIAALAAASVFAMSTFAYAAESKNDNNNNNQDKANTMNVNKGTNKKSDNECAQGGMPDASGNCVTTDGQTYQ